jgi:hypothetical protein
MPAWGAVLAPFPPEGLDGLLHRRRHRCRFIAVGEMEQHHIAGPQFDEGPTAELLSDPQMGSPSQRPGIESSSTSGGRSEMVVTMAGSAWSGLSGRRRRSSGQNSATTPWLRRRSPTPLFLTGARGPRWFSTRSFDALSCRGGCVVDLLGVSV